jgi:DNA-directed RNA polymerase sigma subunit (sigma70/sigma32)
MINTQKDLNDFLENLYSDELKKTVLLARANGETLSKIGTKLGVTKEFVRQVEAKITRKFALSQSGSTV